MCTNSRLVSSLECYMDELVDCFEDFVKKSLFIISVAVGALIVMLGYVLKVITERAQGPQMGIQGASYRPDATVNSVLNATDTMQSSYRDDEQNFRSSAMPVKPVHSVIMPFLRNENKRTTSAAANTNPLSSVPSFDEKLLRNIGLSSCSKSCIQGKRSVMRNCSASRITLPSMPTCIPKHHISSPRACSKFIANRNSCCSMCCADDDRR